MKKILLTIAILLSVYSAHAQENKSYTVAMDKYKTITLFLDSMICKKAAEAMERPTKEQCSQALTNLLFTHSAALNIAKRLQEQALEEMTKCDTQTIIQECSALEQIFYAYTALESRGERISSVIEMNKYNRAKWNDELRYRVECRDGFLRAAKEHQIILW
jgi:hypothetical protein